MNSFSHLERSSNIKKIKSLGENAHFDLVIVGGGITGAGVARDASLRGLKVLLVESEDFAFGTSSRSSKLIHGGLRYLENLEFHLVFEALSERNLLFKIAPHLVHPLRFLLPVYKKSRVGMFKMGCGMWLYDALSLFRAPEIHQKLNASQTSTEAPSLESKELLGSFVYSDAYMDDDRLTIETLRSANEAGAVCLNYVSAESTTFSSANESREVVDRNSTSTNSHFSGHERIQSLRLKDRLSGEVFEVSCHHLVSTLGPWTDIGGEKFFKPWKKILKPSKGIHLTLSRKRLPVEKAIVMSDDEKQRIIFVIPRHEMVIVGTTDTAYDGDPSGVQTTEEDVDYLIEVLDEYFPNASLKKEDFISSYAGVRPLVASGASNVGKTSREHTIISDPRGLTIVAGGKYTTYRKMAEEIVDRVVEDFSEGRQKEFSSCETAAVLNPKCSVENLHLAFEKIGFLNVPSERVKKNPDIKINPWLEKLVFRHGMEAFDILFRSKIRTDLEDFDDTSSLGKKIIYQSEITESEYYRAETWHAIHRTQCLHLKDFYLRRVPIFLSREDQGLGLLEPIAAEFQKYLGWSSDQLENEKAALKEHIDSELSWKSYTKSKK